MKSFLLILCLSISASLFSQEDLEEPIQRLFIDEYRDKSENSFDEKRYTDALYYSLKVLELDSTDVTAYLISAFSYRAMSLYPEALRHINKRAELYPYSSSYSNRGAFYLELGYDSLALDNFNEAIRRDSEYAIAYNNRGLLYLSIGQYDKALEDLELAVEIKPEFVQSYLNKGKIYSALYDFKQAIENFDWVIFCRPHSGYAMYYKARALIFLQRMEEAQQSFQQAVEAFTESIKDNNTYDYQLLLYRANAYQQLGLYDLAQADYLLLLEKQEEIIRHNPQSPVMIYRRALAYKGLRKYDEALVDLQQVLHLRPLYVEAQTELAEIKRLIAKDEDEDICI